MIFEHIRHVIKLVEENRLTSVRKRLSKFNCERCSGAPIAAQGTNHDINVQ